jgi:hypothetical protein
LGKRTNASLKHQQTLKPLLCFEVLKGALQQRTLSAHIARAGLGKPIMKTLTLSASGAPW